jgi:hypothetical protein
MPNTAQISLQDVNPFEGLSRLGRLPEEVRPPTTQAERVLRKFGGVRKLARILGLAPSTVARWNWPKSKAGGTGGRIPSDKLEKIMSVARAHGVLLTDEDILPKPLPRKWVRYAHNE